MPEPPRKKLNLGSLRTNGESLDIGSAIVFWHESEGSPPAVRAISLRDLSPISPNSSVTEKTICRANYRGVAYHCIVIWIEEDKTPDELASMRLFPGSSERTYEDKGYTWAQELGLVHIQRPQSAVEDGANGMTSWMPSDVPMPEPMSGSWDSRSDVPEELAELDDGAAAISVPETLTVNGVVPSTDLSHEGATLIGTAQRSSGPQPGGRKLQDKVVNLSAQVLRMRETIAALRQQKKSSEAFSNRKHLPTFLNSFDDDEEGAEQFGPGSPSQATPSPTDGDFNGISDPIDEELLAKMLAQTTWKKALKLGMKSVFTTEELLTSVPTERGARMSKNGKKALDQQRLGMVKTLVGKYCQQKDIWMPSNELVHQELGGILFSIREANNPTPKPTKTQAMKREGVKIGQFHTFRGMGRKTGGAPIRPGYSFKLPTFSSAMDLSDRDREGKQHAKPSPTPTN